ncbi:hypothetical protein LOD99_3794 [Oopsacas minuta]|uniref:EF-hand domain-containing protein n=1 Tax=Oopsacas minuta TaxID=111878 RepID=A0AAV7JXU4_9METZ|nr:hypothetical protein LOD99_3794 [Oopsacas minuta]
MSRTDGIYLPRLPPSHMRVGTLPVTAQSYSWLREQTRDLATDPLGSVIPPEPAHKAFLGSPRYDLPPHVYSDPVMYEEVFIKEVPPTRKLPDRMAERPLTYNAYDSLHDPHCRGFLLNSRVFRRHLERQGFVTSDMRVVAAPSEQRQRVRAHELLERREMLIEKLRERNEDRKLRLRETPTKLPKILKWSIEKSQAREKQKQFNIHKLKSYKRITEIETKKNLQDLAEKEAKRIEALLENLELQREKYKLENEQRFNRQLKQDYERRFADKKRGKDIAFWRMESDRIHNRIIHMTLLKWTEKQPDTPAYQLDDTVTSYLQRLRIEDLTPLSEQGEDQKSVIGYLADDNERQELIEQIISDISKESITPIEERRGDTTPDNVPLAIETIPSPTVSSRADEVVEISYSPIEQDIELDTQDGILKEPENVVVEPRSPEDTASDLDRPSETDAFSGEEEFDLTYLTPMEKFYYIMNESLRSVDPEDTGSVMLEGLLQVLKQPNLGLYLTDEELHFIGSQFGTNRFQTVNYNTILPNIPQILSAIYHQRSQQQLINYSYSFEEMWCQLYHPNTGYLYFNKFSQQLTDERPEDFRPSLKDDLFEEVVIEMIFLTDARKDGVIDQDEFNNFISLQSTLTTNQISELRDGFNTLANVTKDGVFYLHYNGFVELAHQLIKFLYQNMLPGKSVWVELPSIKVKSFWFNKQTGQTSLTRPKSEESVRTPEKRTTIGSRPQPLPAIEEVPSRPTSTVPTPILPEGTVVSATPTPPALKRKDTPRNARRSILNKETVKGDESKRDSKSDQELETKLSERLSSQPIKEETGDIDSSKFDTVAVP